MNTPAHLRDLEAFRIGHAHHRDSATGCTVFIAEQGAVASVDVRGGGPATRETDLLAPTANIQEVYAVVLSGGSAFGLEASCGVMDELASRDIGYHLAGACVPIVVGASLFDLPLATAAYPDKAMGRAAASRALGERGLNDPRQGNVGAGCGATVGKFARPDQAMKSGFGWSCQRLGDLIVGAGVALNALGSICDREGHWIAGVHEGSEVLDPREAFGGRAQAEALTTNTTLAVVLTNATLTKPQANRVATLAHDGYARAIKPVHTSADGDTCFVMASGAVKADPDVVGVFAAEVVQDAIIAAALEATGAYGLPSSQDLLRRPAGSTIR